MVVVTRKLGGVGAEPTILHSTIPHPSPGPGLSTEHTIRNRDVLQCSVSSVQAAPCLAQFLTVLGRTKIMQVVGRGREAVSGVKGSKHTARHQSGDKAAGVFVSFFVDTLLPES